MPDVAPPDERLATSCICCDGTDLKRSPAILMPFVAHRVFGWQPVEITDEWGLRSIKNGMAYSICNSLLCSDCHHLFLDLRFSDAELHSLYDGYRGEEYTSLRERYEPGYRNRNDALNSTINYLDAIQAFLAPYVDPPLAILDWGGDSGKNAPFNQNRSLLHVYDISNMPVIEGAEKVDRDIIAKTRYDLVVCMNVLEHIPFPRRLVLDLKAAMSADTVLYIEVPHEDLIRESEKRDRLHTDKKHWHEHINFFNEMSIARLIAGCGLTILSIRDINVTVGEKPGYVFQVACGR